MAFYDSAIDGSVKKRTYLEPGVSCDRDISPCPPDTTTISAGAVASTNCSYHTESMTVRQPISTDSHPVNVRGNDWFRTRTAGPRHRLG